MSLILGYASQFLIIAIALWAVGCFIEALRMQLQELRRAKIRWLTGAGRKKPIYSGDDWFFYPATWPLRAFTKFNQWLDTWLEA